jgi:hypothetical protein
MAIYNNLNGRLTPTDFTKITRKVPDIFHRNYEQSSPQAMQLQQQYENQRGTSVKRTPTTPFSNGQSQHATSSSKPTLSSNFTPMMKASMSALSNKLIPTSTMSTSPHSGVSMFNTRL